MTLSLIFHDTGELQIDDHILVKFTGKFYIQLPFTPICCYLLTFFEKWLIAAFVGYIVDPVILASGWLDGHLHSAETLGLSTKAMPQQQHLSQPAS